ncbi:MAG: hypothetical protein ACRDLN_17665, partial [Solirubrobacteraceae bacterium]
QPPRSATMVRMNQLRTSLLAAAVAGAVLTPAAVAQGAPTTLAVEQAPTRVAAWNGTVMWSRFDPASQTYSLVKSVDGAAPVPVGVPARAGSPFDIDLGTNRSGSTYAVYTRDGDIYRLNVATGAETRIDRLSSPQAPERDPTIMRGEIAFVRRVGGFDQLRIGNTTSGSTGSRLLVRKRSILKPELGTKHVVYVVTGPGPISADGAQFVRIRNLRTGADHQIYRAVSGGANAAGVTRPTYVDRPEGFLWARTNHGSGRGNRIIRYTLRGSALAYAQGTPFYNSTAWAGGALGAATASSLDSGDSQGACADGGTNYCKVELSGPLRFDLRP